MIFLASQSGRPVNFLVVWTSGQESLGDYHTKNNPPYHHQQFHPFYLHLQNSPTILQRYLVPRTLRGCVSMTCRTLNYGIYTDYNIFLHKRKLSVINSTTVIDLELGQARLKNVYW